MKDGPLLEFTSHVKGKNAKVQIHGDRIEWTERSALGRSKNSEMIPMRSVTSVAVTKSGLAMRSVQVVTSGNTIDFRVDKGKADEVRGLLTDLLLGRHPTQQPPAGNPLPPPVP